MAEENTAHELAPGVWVVRFVEGKLGGADCAHLLPALLESVKQRPIILLAALPPGTAIIPATLAPFWLNAVLLKGLKVRAIGVVNANRALRVAMMGFQAALKLRGSDIQVNTLPTEVELVAWARALP